MIGKITRGSRPGDIGAYLHGEGRLGEHVWRDESGREHVGGVVIGGNLAREGDTRETRWAADLREAVAGRPDSKRPIWHASLRCAPEDRALSDEEWRGAVQEIAEKMGWDQHPHVIVRHADDHVHVVMSRVDYEGNIWVGKNDARRLQDARKGVEQRLGLRQVPTRTAKRGREAAEGRLKAGEYRRSLVTGKDPARVQLADRVQRCVGAAEGMGREVFEQALERAGVQFEVNVASTGRVSGYRFAMSQDAQGEPVWFKASQLDRSLSWSKVGQRIEAVEPVRVQPIQAEPKRLFESKSSHAQRVEQAEQATRQAQLEAVAAKRAQRLRAAEPPTDLRSQIGAKQRAQAYQERVQKRQDLLRTVGLSRQLREPEDGWKSLKQIDKATRQRTASQRRTRAHGVAAARSYQQRQQQETSRDQRGRSR